jgi:hypothetical protein
MSQRIRHIILWVKDHFTQIINISGALCLSLASILPSVEGKKDALWLISTNYGRFLILGFILYIIGGLIGIYENINATNLKKQITKLNLKVEQLSRGLKLQGQGYFEILNDELYLLFLKLGFKEKERISLYKYNGEQFELIGRYSTDPLYKSKESRVYANNQGFIGHAWKNGKAFVNNLPSPSDLTKYCQVLEEQWKIPESVSRKLVLKSRTIMAFKISNFNGIGIGIIVFESEQKAAFTQDKIQKVMNDIEERRIGLLLEQIARIESNYAYVEQSLEYARQEGF